MRDARAERTLHRLPRLVVIVCVSTLTGACSAQARETSQVTPAASTSRATATPSLTAKATYTASPTATGIPGLEGWSVVSPQDTEIRSNNGSLVMTLKHKALWSMQQRGVLVYKLVSGNYRIMVDVHTSKRSDTSQAPGGDGSVQLAGVMARNGERSQENYVFVVVGDDGNGLLVETKNTVESLSKFNSPDWGLPNAELRLCRFDSTVSVYKRHTGTTELWVQAATYQRPDLPEILQVGLNIYTDSTPDLQARYGNIKIEQISDEKQRHE